MPNVPLFGRAMNVNASGKCISILGLQAFEPDNSCNDRITARGVTGADTLAGQTTASLTVRKNFFVE